VRVALVSISLEPPAKKEGGYGRTAEKSEDRW
jgi:hypothetical protein